MAQKKKEKVPAQNAAPDGFNILTLKGVNVDYKDYKDRINRNVGNSDSNELQAKEEIMRLFYDLWASEKEDISKEDKENLAKIFDFFQNSDDLERLLILMLLEEYKKIYGEDLRSLSDEYNSYVKSKIGITFRNIIRHLRGNRKEFYSSTLWNIESKVKEWRYNDLALFIIKNFIKSKGKRFKLIHDIIFTFYKHIEDTFSQLDFSRLLKDNTPHSQKYISKFLKDDKLAKPKLDVILQIMFYIYNLNFNKVNEFLKTDIDKVILKKIKEKVITICNKFIFYNNIISLDARHTFELVKDAILLISKGRNEYISIYDLSLLLELNRNNIYDKLNKVRNFKAKKLESLKNLILGFKHLDVKKVEKFLKYYRWYEENFIYRRFRDYQKETEIRKRFFENCFDLLVEQAGFDGYDLLQLDDNYIEWVRHHIDEDKYYIFINKMVLTSRDNNMHKIIHKWMMGRKYGGNEISLRDILRDRAKILSNKKYIKELINLDSERGIRESDIPNDFKVRFRTQMIIDDFLERINYIRNKGIISFVKHYYVEFYKRMKEEDFYKHRILSISKK
jgi:hypothetical protein